MNYKILFLLFICISNYAYSSLEYAGHLLLTHRSIDKKDYWNGGELNLKLQKRFNEKRDDFGLLVRPADKLILDVDYFYNNQRSVEDNEFRPNEIGFKKQFGSHFSLFLGDTILMWGKADEINPADVWNGENLSFFITRKAQYRKIARSMAVLEWNKENKKLQIGVALQDKRMRHSLAAKTSPWCNLHCQNFDKQTIEDFYAGYGQQVHFKTLKANTGVDSGMRFSHTYASYDYSLFLYHGTERFPFYTKKTLTPTEVEYTPYTNFLTSYGFDIKKAIDRFTLVAEVKYTIDRPFYINPRSSSFITDQDGIILADEIDWILGVDAILPHEFYLNVQYFKRNLVQEVKDAYFWGNREMLSLKLTKNLDDSYKLEYLQIFDHSTGNYSQNLELTYKHSDSLELSTGFIVFENNSIHSALAGLRNNDSIYFDSIYKF